MARSRLGLIVFIYAAALSGAHSAARIHTSAEQTAPRQDELKRLAAALKDPLWTHRNDAIAELRKLGPPDAVPLLIAAIDDPTPRNRDDAIYALASFGSDAALAVHKLIRIARERRDGNARLRAVVALGAIGDPSAVPVLITALFDEDPLITERSVQALSALGPAAKDASRSLASLLTPEPSRIAYLARDALARIGPATIPALLERIEIVGQLPAELRPLPKTDPRRDDMEFALRDRQETLRTQAAMIVQHIGESAVAPLIIALQTARPENREHVAYLLGELGPVAKSAISPLKDALARSSPGSEAHHVITEALRKIGRDF